MLLTTELYRSTDYSGAGTGSAVSLGGTELVRGEEIEGEEGRRACNQAVRKLEYFEGHLAFMPGIVHSNINIESKEKKKPLKSLFCLLAN